ncbi:MAG: hypothetical protein H0V46_07480 [Sphingomonas sp.]|nr:hypothetical protein [Sphingomonas sp.]
MNRSAFAIAAASALIIASSANAAEPAPLSPRPAEPTAATAPALLASASAVQVPTPQNAAETSRPAKKPRAARVTSCRCGEASPR